MTTRFSTLARGLRRGAAWRCFSWRPRRSASPTTRPPSHKPVDAFALQNAYEFNYGLEPGQVVVLLNAGASTINVSILDGEQSVFTRNISIGGSAYTEAIQKEIDLPAESAEQLKKGIPVDGATFDDAQPVLRAVTENVLLEIQKTFDFFRATAASDQVHRIMLSGGASRVEGLREALQERFDTEVDDLDPFRAISWDPKALGAEAVDVRWASTSKGRRPMIRVNLLGGDRPVAKSGFTFDEGQRVAVAVCVIMIATVAGVGRWYWTLGEASTSLDTQIVAAQQEQIRLQNVISEVTQFEQQRGQLQQRVALIEDLRSGQSIPVQLLDHVSRSVPDLLWLTQLEQDGGAVTIQGRSTTLIGLSDFVANPRERHAPAATHRDCGQPSRGGQHHGPGSDASVGTHHVYGQSATSAAGRSGSHALTREA